MAAINRRLYTNGLSYFEGSQFLVILQDLLNISKSV